uniref:NAD-dependent epimerase/dehydratase family protein n=1 Tax=Fulvivirga sp. TaxID=1931237 RepID=UPI004048F8CC
MRVLITGGAGAIGLHLARYLREFGNQVVICDNFSRSQKDAVYSNIASSEGVFEYMLDLSDPRQVAELPLDVDYVYHMAA